MVLIYISLFSSLAINKVYDLSTRNFEFSKFLFYEENVTPTQEESLPTINIIEENVETSSTTTAVEVEGLDFEQIEGMGLGAHKFSILSFFKD